VTNEQADEIKRSFPVADGKVTVIDNGFDEDDFTSNQASGSFPLPSGFFHLSHFGTIYSGFSGSFFPALAQLLRDRPDWRERLRVNIFGFPDETVRRYSESSELNGVIHLHGFLKHSAALEAMRASDCLLLFLANPEMARLAVSGKTYEYLRAGRPILAVAYEGGVKRLIEEGQAGWVVHPEDTQTMKQVLQILLGEGQEKQNYQPIRPDFVAQFRYDRLAGSLASVLDKVVSHVH
jgi:glycosyltransferase involved in cell wall biosynthesis